MTTMFLEARAGKLDFVGLLHGGIPHTQGCLAILLSGLVFFGGGVEE